MISLRAIVRDGVPDVMRAAARAVCSAVYLFCSAHPNSYGPQLSPAGPKCALWNPRSSRAAGQPQPSNLRGFKAPLVMSFVLSCKVATDTQVQFTIKCTFASIVAARRDVIAGRACGPAGPPLG